MSQTFTFHADPSHGWLEVTRADLTAVGLKPTDFSGYSYASNDGRRFFLEEDCDAPKFIDAYKAKHGAKPEFNERFTNSRSTIRNMNPIDIHVAYWVAS